MFSASFDGEIGISWLRDMSDVLRVPGAHRRDTARKGMMLLEHGWDFLWDPLLAGAKEEKTPLFCSSADGSDEPPASFLGLVY